MSEEPEDRASPPPSPQESARTNRETTNITLLPFSPQPTTANTGHSEQHAENSPHQSSESDSDEEDDIDTRPRSAPVLRDASQTEQLQLKYYQLQLEMKRIRDDLNSLGKMPSSVGADSDETQINIDSSKDRPHLHPQQTNNTRPQPDDSLLAQIAVLKSEKQGLTLENAKLRETETRLKREQADSKLQLQNLTAKWSKLEDQTRNSANIAELTRELNEVRADLASIRASASLISEENAQLKNEISDLRSAKRSYTEAMPSSEQIEDLRRQLSYALKAKSNMSTMLSEQLDINDRNERLLSDAETLINDLRQTFAEMHQGSADTQTQLEQVRQQLHETEAAKAAQEREIESLKTDKLQMATETVQLKQAVDAQTEKSQDEKKVRKELESRLAQQQRELERADAQLRSLNEKLSSQAEELNKKSASLIEARAHLEDANKRIDMQSDMLHQRVSEYNDAQKVIDQLRATLHDTQTALEVKVNALYETTKVKESLELRIESLTAQMEQLNREHKQAEAKWTAEQSENRTAMAEEERKHQANIEALNRERVSDLEAARERARVEMKTTVSKYTLRESELKSRIIGLDEENRNLKDDRADMKNTCDSLQHNLRRTQVDKTRLEEELAETAHKLKEAEVALRSAQSETLHFRNEFEGAKKTERLLQEKLDQLEKQLTRALLKEQESTVEDIGSLKRQVQDGANAANELLRLRNECAEHVAEWERYSNACESQMRHLLEQNQKLNEELTTLKRSEADREMQLRSSVQQAHHSELEKLQMDYQYSVDILKNSLAEATSERDAVKKEYLENFSNMQQVQFDRDLKIKEIDQQKKVLEQQTAEMQEAAKLNDSLHDQVAQLTKHTKELQSRMSQLSETLSAKETLVSELQQKWNETNLALKHETNLRLQTQDDLENRDKTFRHFSERLLTILYFNNQQVQSLIFIKSYFTKSFPRTDLVWNVDGTQVMRKRRTFRGAVMFVLATVKFKNALKYGTKSKAQESEQILMRG